MIKPEPQFLSKQLANSEARVIELLAVVEKLAERLGAAEDALRFYSNPKNYSHVGDSHHLSADTVYQDRVKADFSDPDNHVKAKVAGARARLYFKRYEDLPYN